MSISIEACSIRAEVKSSTTPAPSSGRIQRIYKQRIVMTHVIMALEIAHKYKYSPSVYLIFVLDLITLEHSDWILSSDTDTSFQKELCAEQIRVYIANCCC